MWVWVAAGFVAGVCAASVAAKRAFEEDALKDRKTKSAGVAAARKELEAAEERAKARTGRKLVPAAGDVKFERAPGRVGLGKAVRPILFVDLDNTVADLDAALQIAFEAKYPDRKRLWPRGRSTFEFPKEVNDLIRPILNSEGFFLNLAPIPGAVETIATLSLEADVFFLTSPIRETGLPKRCAGEKIAWVEKHFGADMARRMIIGKPKPLVGCAGRPCFLVDDNPAPEETGAPELRYVTPMWIHIVFAQSYNRDACHKRPHIERWDAGDIRAIFAAV